MKKCKNCGMIQSDDNTVCLDCSSPLGSSMEEEENQKAEQTLKAQIDDMIERSDEFYVPLRDKVMGYACVFFFVMAVLLIALAYTELGTLEEQRVTEINGIEVPIPFELLLPTERMNQLSDAMGCGWISILFAIMSSLALLLPRMMWLFETWKYRAHYGWDTPALPHVMMARKISAYIAWAISIASLIYGWILFF